MFEGQAKEMVSTDPNQHDTLEDRDDEVFDNSFCLSSHILDEFVDPDQTAEYSEENVDNLDETFHNIHHRSSAMSAALDNLAAKSGLLTMASYLASKLP